MDGGSIGDVERVPTVMFRKWFRISGPRKAMPEPLITIEIHHGGYFERQPDGLQKYKVPRSNKTGGVCWVDEIDPDYFTWLDLCFMAYELGYREKPISYHFKAPKSTTDEGWIQLASDGDCQELCKLVNKKTKTISIYVTGGGQRRVEEAMRDDQGLNPPRPLGWLNPLTLMTENEKKNVVSEANQAAINLYVQQGNRVAATNVQATKFIVVDDDESDEEPLGTLGPLPSINEFIDDIGTQSSVNRRVEPVDRDGGVRIVDMNAEQGVRQGHLSNLLNVEGQTEKRGDNVGDNVVSPQPSPFRARNKQLAGRKKKAPVNEHGRCATSNEEVLEKNQPPKFVATQASVLTDDERRAWEEHFVEEERRASGSQPKKVVQKRSWRDKKSSAGREVSVEKNQPCYNTRNKGKGKEHIDAEEDDYESDSSDGSFILDSDFEELDVGLDDDELFRENVGGDEHVEEHHDMGYGGEISDDGWDSEDFLSLDGTDDEYDEEGNLLSAVERRERRLRCWNRRVDLVNPHFFLGQLFPNGAEFREAVREYHIRHRRGVWFRKNQKKKIEIKCQPGCNFYVYAKLLEDRSPTMQVRTLRNEHSCEVLNRSIHFTYHRVAAEIREQVLVDPSWSYIGIQETLQKKYHLDIPIGTVSRGKRKAMRMNEGHYIEQYNLLYAYKKELKRSNPGTTCEILCSHEEGVARFQRIYICFGALKEGWLKGCRSIIGLDGTHLRGKHTGVLLCAVGVDGNNGMFPIAFAVVEIENTETWRWFLEFLGDDLGLVPSSNYAFISDKQKGIGNVMKDLFPDSEHRHCWRHIYNNLKSAGHTGEGLKQTFWNAARCTQTRWWEEAMNEMKTQSSDAWEWFQKDGRQPIHWAKSHFRLTTGCDILINNICEVFNASIAKARSKPILTMLEMIRYDLMTRMANRRVAVTKWRKPCGPRIVKQIEKISKFTCEWQAIMAGEYIYQVQGGLHGTQHCVDLRKHTCSCRKWQLSGIPCVHAIKAIRSKQWDPTSFVSDMLKAEAYKRSYEPILMPLSDKTEWEAVNCPLAPPTYLKKVGRPPMKRRPSAGENLAPPPPSNPTKLSRKGSQMTCQTCKKKGHNKAGCPPNKVSGSSNAGVDGSETSHGGALKRKRYEGNKKAVPKQATSTAETILVRSRKTAKKAMLLDKNKGGNTGQGSSRE